MELCVYTFISRGIGELRKNWGILLYIIYTYTPMFPHTIRHFIQNSAVQNSYLSYISLYFHPLFTLSLYKTHAKFAHITRKLRILSHTLHTTLSIYSSILSSIFAYFIYLFYLCNMNVRMLFCLPLYLDYIILSIPFILSLAPLIFFLSSKQHLL
jgi:hypothetical protein